MDRIEKLLNDAMKLAAEYKQLTGKPLGITGEIGEFVASKYLGIELASARQAGYDALSKEGERIQIKSRCLNEKSKKSQRVGSLSTDNTWDKVVLVIMDSTYHPIGIYECNRDKIIEELMKPGSKARNERGALSVSKFKKIGRLIYPS